jgi:hypothetical protein
MKRHGALIRALGLNTLSNSLRRQIVSLFRRLVSVDCPVRDLVFAIVEKLGSYGLSPIKTALGRSTLTTVHQEDGVVDFLTSREYNNCASNAFCLTRLRLKSF